MSFFIFFFLLVSVTFFLPVNLSMFSYVVLRCINFLLLSRPSIVFIDILLLPLLLFYNWLNQVESGDVIKFFQCKEL